MDKVCKSLSGFARFFYEKARAKRGFALAQAPRAGKQGKLDRPPGIVAAKVRYNKPALQTSTIFNITPKF